MRFKTRTSYETSNSRILFATFLSNTIEGADHPEVPYQPNDNDDYYWTLDSNNKWKVKFFYEDPYSFEIIHRYQGGVNKFEEALAGWLEYKLGVERV
jgi:hypothetical protein